MTEPIKSNAHSRMKNEIFFNTWSNLTKESKLILMYALRHRNQNGISKFNLFTISNELKISDAKLEKAIKDLTEKLKDSWTIKKERNYFLFQIPNIKNDYIEISKEVYEALRPLTPSAKILFWTMLGYSEQAEFTYFYDHLEVKTSASSITELNFKIIKTFKFPTDFDLKEKEPYRIRICQTSRNELILSSGLKAKNDEASRTYWTALKELKDKKLIYPFEKGFILYGLYKSDKPLFKNSKWEKIEKQGNEKFEPLTTIYKKIVDKENNLYFGIPLNDLNEGSFKLNEEYLQFRINGTYGHSFDLEGFLLLEKVIIFLMFKRKENPEYQNKLDEFLKLWNLKKEEFKELAKTYREEYL